MQQRRLVSQNKAIEYLGVSKNFFNKLLRLGVIPNYIPGTKKYDLRAIDHALDKIGGVVDSKEGYKALLAHPQFEDKDASYERFKAEQGII